jgi:hypothetical protein
MVRNTDPPALPLPPRHRCRARAPQPIAGSQSADGARERSPGRPATCRNVDRHRGGAPPPHPPAHSAVAAAKGRDGPAGRRAWGLCPSAAPVLEPSPVTGRWCRGVARAEADPLAQVGQPAGESWPARWQGRRLDRGEGQDAAAGFAVEPAEPGWKNCRRQELQASQFSNVQTGPTKPPGLQPGFAMQAGIKLPSRI